jgi:hypothetical protein
MRTIVAHIFLALLTTTVPVTGAFAESTSEAMRAFGLVGTWSVDCSIEISQPCMTIAHCSGRLSFLVPQFASPFLEFDSQTNTPGQVRKIISPIESAQRVTEDKIKLVTLGTEDLKGRVQYLLPVRDEKWDTIYIREGNKLRVWSFKRSDGMKVRIDNGKIYEPEPSWKPEHGAVQRWVQSNSEVNDLEKCLN